MNLKSSDVLKAFFLSVFLITSFFLISKDLTVNKNQNSSKLQIFSDSEGNPALCMGYCQEEDDCLPSGCSSMICTNHEVTTTCELGRFPEKETYKCGCQNNKCVWYRYR